jgi:hypothetical protein
MVRNLLESEIPEEMVTEQHDPDVQFRKEESMLGEELNSSYVTERGLVGDREYALIDQKTDKVPRTPGNGEGYSISALSL